MVSEITFQTSSTNEGDIDKFIKLANKLKLGYYCEEVEIGG